MVRHHDADVLGQLSVLVKREHVGCVVAPAIAASILARVAGLTDCGSLKYLEMVGSEIPQAFANSACF